MLKTIRSSFDPNDKQENHNTSISKTYINDGEYLQYLVRFQNTGNDTAFTVKIVDDLDSNTIAESVDVIATSHNYELNRNYKNKLTFLFKNILLPDSTTDKIASMGYIIFKVKVKSAVNVGDSISNIAYIYFDYNDPIITNRQVTNITSLILPLQINYFTAHYTNNDFNKVSINWSITEPNSTSYFEIQRSENAAQFKTIQEIKASENEKYNFVDLVEELNQQNVNLIGYRLKITSKNGNITYSNIQYLQLKNKKNISIFPNPAKKEVFIRTEKVNKIEIIDILGKTQLQKKILGDLTKLNIANLNTGIYRVLVTYTNGTTHSETLVID